jgi:hypothetical protein
MHHTMAVPPYFPEQSVYMKGSYRPQASENINGLICIFPDNGFSRESSLLNPSVVVLLP